MLTASFKIPLQPILFQKFLLVTLLFLCPFPYGNLVPRKHLESCLFCLLLFLIFYGTCNMCHSNCNLSNWTKDFLASPHFSQATSRIYSTGLLSFKRWCKVNGVSMPVQQDILLFRAWLLGQYRISTAQTYLATVKLFFSWLGKHHLYQDVAAGVQGIKVNRTVPMRDYLDTRHVRILLNQLSKRAAKTGSLKDLRNYAMILLTLTCGLRVSEVARLDVDDLYWSSGTYCLLVHGKGRDGKSDAINVPENVAMTVFHWLEIQSSFWKNGPMFVSLTHQYRRPSLFTDCKPDSETGAPGIGI